MYFDDEEKNSHETITPMLPKEKVKMKDKTCCPRETNMGGMNSHVGTSDALEVKYPQIRRSLQLNACLKNLHIQKL